MYLFPGPGGGSPWVMGLRDPMTVSGGAAGDAGATETGTD